MKVILYFLLLVISFNCYAQEIGDNVYIYFNSNSTEQCYIPKEQQGRYHGIDKVKKYQKIKQENGSINFYICNELFVFNKNVIKDTCTVNSFNNLKKSKIEDLLKIVNKVNPLSPWLVFKKVYLIEKINDTTVIKYNVKWLYYTK